MLELYKNAAATVSSASTDRVRLFVDTDGLPYVKDQTGAVTPLKGDQGAPGAGVIAGGTTGQVLAKASATNYDTTWVNPTGAVDSVNGQTGVVVLDAADVGAEPADATILKDADIGVTVQGYNANTVVDASYVHTDNNYTTTEQTKLAGIAAGAEVNVNADWNSVSGDSQILNKPSLATVATTGAYSDLTGKPTLGTAAAAATTDFATAAQGTKADSAVQPAAIANMLETSDIGVTVQGYSAVLAGTTASFTTADETKLDGIATGAEVNVNADWNAVSGDAQILNKPTLYSDAAVDTHLNTSTATTGEVLSWNGTDYDWTTPPAGYSDAAVDTHLNTATATAAQVLSWTGTDYDWVTPSGGGGSALTISNKTGAYTVVAGDLGTIINCTANTFTVSLTAAATLGAGFNCWIWNTSTTSTHLITIDPNGTETIDGASTIVLSPGQGFNIVCTGTSFIAGDQKTLRMYAENQNSTVTATATGANAVSIGDAASASGSRGMAFGSSSVASGTNSLALGRAATSSGILATAIGFGPVASSTYAFAAGTHSGGFSSQAVTGTSAMALGGSYASGTDSFAAAIASTSSSYGATGANSIAIGYQAKATNTGSIAIGGQQGVASPLASGSQSIALVHALASGATSFAWGHSAFDRPTASGSRSVAFGTDCFSSQLSAYAFGTYAVSAIIGKYAYSSSAFSAATRGDSQTGLFVLRCATTNATATVLTTDNSTATATNQVILPNNSAYAFTGTIIARQQASGGSNFAAWEIKGGILRNGTAASTTLGSFNINTLSKTAGASAWTIALTADTTNGGLAITVTGVAATNIRWVATVQTSEVTYA